MLAASTRPLLTLILFFLGGLARLDAQALAFQTQTLPAAQVGSNYTFTVLATGGNGTYNFALNSGFLPPGITLQGAGVIQGTPTTAGSYLFTLRLESGAETVLRTFNLNVASNAINGLEISTISLPQGQILSPYQATLTATGGTAPYSFQIVSGSLPNGISFVSSGQLLGSPNVAGTSTFTVRVTDAALSIFDRTLSITVNSNVLAVSTTTLPNGQAGFPYNASLAATGGAQPYTFGLVSGALPGGIQLSTGGALSGTPSAVGTANFRVRVTDGQGSIAERNLSITVNPAPLNLSVVPIPSAVRNIGFNFSLTASGGSPAYTFSLLTGALPAGLSLSNGGVISGTPTVLGIFPFTVRVTDSASATKDGNFTLTVNATNISITPTTLPAGAVGVNYSTSFAVTGGAAPYLFSVTSGSLPAGLSISQNGTISGTPTAAGTSLFTVGIVDSTNATASASISLTISPSAITISTSNLAIGQVGQLYSSSLTASGGSAPYTFTYLSGAVPPGLTLFGTGTISGIPSTSGNFSFTVRATDAIGAFAEQVVILSVLSTGLSITTVNLPGAQINTAYSATVNASGGQPPYVFSLASGPLPPGLNLAANGSITGTPTQSGNYPVTVRVTDNFNATALANYTISVSSGVISLLPSSLSNAVPGVAYTNQFTASGGASPYNYTLLNGNLPPGIFLSVGGLLSGTTTTPGIYTFTVRVRDNNNLQADFTYSLTVTGGALSIVNPTLPTGLAGSVYAASFVASGGVQPYTWSIPSGSLPPGLTLSNAGNVTGTPTQAGTYNFLVRVRDFNNTSVDASASITINNPGTMTITTTTLPTAQVTVLFNQQLVVAGGTAPYVWQLTAGQLPPGLSLSNSGVLSGVPSSSGSYSFTVRVQDSTTANTQSTLTILVSASGLAILTSSLPPAAIGQAYYAELSSSGGTPPYAYAILSGVLPTGLTINGNGAISGIPAIGGSFPLVFRVIDSAGNNAQTSLTLSVSSSLLSFVTTSLNQATAGVAFSQQLQASGGTPPYSFSVASGNLPSGITLSATGLLSGVPTATTAVNLTLRVTDLSGASVTAPFFFAVGQAQLSFTNQAPPNATIGQAYSFTFTATGGVTPLLFSVVNGGVPTGLTLSPSGVLAGVPTQTGGFGFTIRVVDANNVSFQQGFNIAVASSVFSFTTQSLPAGRVNEPYQAALATTGGQAPIVYALNFGGSFPPGLTLNSGGTITGTPTAAGTFTFTVGARDSSTSQLTTQTQLSIVISGAPPRFLTTSLPDGAVDQAYSQTLSATGGSGQLSFSLVSGALPAGLTLTASGVLGGTPRQSGAFPLTFRVRDSSNPPLSADLALTLNIVATTPLTLSDFTPAIGQLHFPYTTTFFVAGGRPPYAFSIDSGSPPNGLRLDPAGVLTGILLAPGVYNFRVVVSDASSQSASLSTSITVNGPLYLPAGQVGVAYNSRIQPDFGTAPYTITVNNSAIGRLPEGLTLNTDGSLSGVPAAAGEYTFGVLIRDASAVFRLATISLRINTPPSGLRLPVLTLPPTSVGAPYEQSLLPIGGSGSFSWNVRSGNLPNGLQLNPLTGQLSGIANVPGSPNFTIEVRDSQGGIAVANYTLTVSAAGPPVQNALVSAASYASGGVAPGELVTIFGNTLGQPTLTMFTLAGGLIPSSLAGTRVLFDGEAAPLIYTRNDQLSAIVPWSVASKPSVRVAVEFLGVQSPPYQVRVLPAKPGIFTADASGSGPGAILNENGSVNSAANPAAKGSIIVVYATGGGAMNPAGVDGRVAPGASSLLLPTTATVGGQNAEVLYSGNAPGLVEGVLQVNLRLSGNTPSGNQTVVLSIGGNPTTANVTVAVQ